MCNTLKLASDASRFSKNGSWLVVIAAASDRHSLRNLRQEALIHAGRITPVPDA